MNSAGNKPTRNKFVTDTLHEMVHSSHIATHHDDSCSTCRSIRTAQPSADEPKERRHLGRVNVNVRVIGDTTGGRFETDLLDLTSSGAFLESILHFPKGTRITLKFKIDSTPIVVPAEVCYSIEHVGFGVRFVDLKDEDWNRIERFLQSRMRA